jgi:hypothetical protein
MESLPLSDAADQRYSRGIHTVTIRALDTGERRKPGVCWCCASPRQVRQRRLWLTGESKPLCAECERQLSLLSAPRMV